MTPAAKLNDPGVLGKFARPRVDSRKRGRFVGLPFWHMVFLVAPAAAKLTAGQWLSMWGPGGADRQCHRRLYSVGVPAFQESRSLDTPI